MTEPSLTAYHVHVFSDIELWCFSFVTLFNLQGTRSVPCSVRNIHYLTTSFSVCQVLFSTFFKIFFRTRLAGACRSEAWLSYHISLALSSTFFDSFQNLFRTQPLSRLSLESLITLPQLPAFVKPFFRFPQNFFQSPGPRTPLGDSSPNISYSRPLVNTFFPVFSCFFQRLAKTFSLIRDIVYEEHPSTTYGTYII